MIAGREHVLSRHQDLDEFLRRHPLHALYGGENAFLLDEYLHALKAAGIKLTKVLNPLESNINLYPQTLDSLKAGIARKFRLPSPALIPDALFSLRGKFMDEPGRLYTFFGHKQDA